MKRIQLKYPKLVFPNKVTKMCEHDWAILTESKSKHLSIHEVKQMQRILDNNRKYHAKTAYFESLAIRDNKGIKLIDLNDDD